MWRGGHAGYRGPSWPQQRRRALERDGHQCVRCKTSEQVTVHHKIPFCLFATHVAANHLSNLETLCRPCHSVADNTFWREHPLFFAGPKFPDCRLLKNCLKCGELFQASPRATVCVKCCTYTCDQCGRIFISRKRREVRFCSPVCNVAFRKSQAIFPHACIECGAIIRSGRFRCYSCYRANPSLEVRPGRKPGRKPKDRSAT